MLCYLFDFLLLALEFLLLGLLLHQSFQVSYLLPSSVKLLPGHFQLTLQDLYLLLELTLLLLTTPLEVKAGDKVC